MIILQQLEQKNSVLICSPDRMIAQSGFSVNWNIQNDQIHKYPAVLFVKYL